jgi:Flp pilus assembly pilin Flp
MIRTFRNDRRGNAAVELAIMAPLLAALLFGSVDLGGAFVTKLALEQAASRAAEMATAPGTVATSYTTLGAEAAAAYGKPYVSAVAESWLECGGVRQANFGTVCGAGAQTARYVSIRIVAEYDPIFDVFGLVGGEGPSGGYLPQGDAVVRIQ